jgi:predicted ester cyclase
MIEQNKSFVRRYLAAISGYDKTPELVNQYVADEHLKEHIASFELAFPRYTIAIDELIAEGDMVVVRGMLYGVQKGAYMGIPATGKEIHVPLIAIYRVVNGKVVAFWAQLDSLLMAQQLGMMPQPAHA